MFCYLDAGKRQVCQGGMKIFYVIPKGCFSSKIKGGNSRMDAMTRKWKIYLIAGLVIGIGFFHYSCQFYLLQYSQIHNVVLKFFYVPIVLAAFWWGLRGGFWVGLACAAIYSVDVFRWREIHDPLLYNDFGEILLMTGLGSLLGRLVDTDHRCRRARVEAEQRAETEFRRSITDPLTQAFNRRYLETLLKECWNLTQKGETFFSLLMIDLDHFKSINDHHGHLVGDRVLQITARTIMGQIRQNDLLFRYGGDEFLILLPQTRQDRALHLAKRLRDEMAKLSFKALDHSSFRTDFSVGVIEYRFSSKTGRFLL